MATQRQVDKAEGLIAQTYGTQRILQHGIGVTRGSIRGAVRDNPANTFTFHKACDVCEYPVTRNRATVLNGITFCGVCYEKHLDHLDKPIDERDEK